MFTWIVMGCNGRLTQTQDTVEEFIPNNTFSVRFTKLVKRKKILKYKIKQSRTCASTYSAASCYQNEPPDTAAAQAKVNCVCKQHAIKMNQRQRDSIWVDKIFSSSAIHSLFEIGP